MERRIHELRTELTVVERRKERQVLARQDFMTVSLVGYTNAGKSTLMKVLYGLYAPDEGEILLNGKPVSIVSPTEAPWIQTFPGPPEGDSPCSASSPGLRRQTGTVPNAGRKPRRCAPGGEPPRSSPSC